MTEPYGHPENQITRRVTIKVSRCIDEYIIARRSIDTLIVYYYYCFLNFFFSLEPSNCCSVTVRKTKLPIQRSVNGVSRNYSSPSTTPNTTKYYSSKNEYSSKSPIRNCCRSTGNSSQTNNYYTVVNIEFKTNVQKVKLSMWIVALHNIQFYKSYDFFKYEFIHKLNPIQNIQCTEIEYDTSVFAYTVFRLFFNL